MAIAAASVPLPLIAPETVISTGVGLPAGLDIASTPSNASVDMVMRTERICLHLFIGTVPFCVAAVCDLHLTS
jgi:hypothetical protein